MLLEKKVPLWVVLLVILLGLVASPLYGALVRSAVIAGPGSGWLSHTALRIAEFPGLVRLTFLELRTRRAPEFFDQQAPLVLTDLSEFAPVPAAVDVPIDGLMVRRTAHAVEEGWRVLVGTFGIAGQPEHGVVLLGPDLTVRRYWPISEPAEMHPRPPYYKFLHGFTMLPDGSMLVAADGGVTLQRFDWCGRRLWAVPGAFHHSIARDDSGASVWTLLSVESGNQAEAVDPAVATKIVRVATDDGRILQEFSLQDVIDANEDIDILELRRAHDGDSGGNSRTSPGSWLADPFHLNDVEPLPAAFADRFKGFEAGDLLISARSLNLVFVLDPGTLKVRWWRMGATQRQHDPDWMPTGEISIFNNRMTRGRSEIVAINPATYERRVIYDGENADFYSRMRGKHQHLPYGNILVTASQQGRVLEITPDGNVALELININTAVEGRVYVLSEAVWFPPEYLQVGSGKECDRY